MERKERKRQEGEKETRYMKERNHMKERREGWTKRKVGRRGRKARWEGEAERRDR